MLLLRVVIAVMSLPPLPYMPIAWHKSFNVHGRPEIRITNSNVDVRVYATERKDLEAILYADRVSSDVHIADNQYANRLQLEVRLPRKWRIGVGERAAILELKVPLDSDISVTSENGSVIARRIEGSLRIRTDIGDIDAQQISGPVNIESGHGDIGLDGTVTSVVLHTHRGSIAAQINPGSKMGSKWILRTEAGNIDLQLPDEFSADLDANAEDGNLHLAFPSGVVAFTRRSSLREPINGGGPQLELRSDRGNIMVRRTPRSF